MSNQGLLGLPQGQRSGVAGRVNVPSVWTLGSPNTSATESVSIVGVTLVPAMWTEITAAMPVDAIIYGIHIGDLPDYNNTEFRLGTGAAGSEVSRWGGFVASTDSSATRQVGSVVIPYGVDVRSGERLAIYYNTTSTFGSTACTVHVYYTRATVNRPQVRGGTTGLVSVSTGATWVQVDAAPPLTNGVWVIGFSAVETGLTLNTSQFGLGASGSEIVATPYRANPRTPSSSRPSEVWIPPFWWPPGTRLAARTSGANIGTQLAVSWRESLS